MDPAVNKFKVAEGDWVCSDIHCGNINFARRNKCNRCGKEKRCTEGASNTPSASGTSKGAGPSTKHDSSEEEEETQKLRGQGGKENRQHRAEGPVTIKKKLGQEIGKVLADKSRGLFSADDWQCIKCGNVNWARRQQCNMCNAPKFGEVEERTGYGGGYNDRGVVEYIQREDSDSEYDEFGRRKKKKKDEGAYERKSHFQKRDNDKSSIVRQEEEEEEEDEEDEDDLSKYDLSDWGVNGDDSKQEEKDLSSRSDHDESRKINRNKRSRSRSPAWKRT